mgnify:FL=1
MRIPDGAEEITGALRAAGHEVYFVGGCVRDALLSRPVNDFDMTTDATPEEMHEIFRSFRTFDTGIKHGTLTVLSGGSPYEITTYRVDGAYSDNRHPDDVSFTRSLREDLARRDFTVNAMALSPEGEIVDPFGGREDLSHGIIRAVGDPRRRFSEDALRILRAVRFSSKLGFTVEEETRRALYELRGNLSDISPERVFSEWTKITEGDGRVFAVRDFLPVIQVFLPELSALDPAALGCDGASEVTAPRALPFAAALFFMAGQGGAAFSSAYSRLRSDTATRLHGAALVDNAGRPFSDIPAALRILADVGEESAHTLVALRSYLASRGFVTLSCDEKSVLSAALASARPYRIADLAVGGREAVAAGLRGERIGEALRVILLRVMDGELANTRGELVKFLHKYSGNEKSI